MQESEMEGGIVSENNETETVSESEVDGRNSMEE